MTGAGDLDRRITIQRATVTLNEFNEEIETWGDLTTVWAKKTDAGGAESLRAQEVGAQIDARFLIRYSSDVSDVNPYDRIVYKGRSYNITHVIEVMDTTNQWIELSTAARADEAAEVVP